LNHFTVPVLVVMSMPSQSCRAAKRIARA